MYNYPITEFFMRGQKGPDTKPPVNVELAQAVYGKDTIVVSAASLSPGFPDRDPTLDEEAWVETLRTSPMPREEVQRRRVLFLLALREMGDVAGMIGANAYDMAFGCWSNDLPEGGAEVLDRLQAEHSDYVKKARRTLDELFSLYAKDPRYSSKN